MQVNKCCWENDTKRFVQCRVATNLPFVLKKKKAITEKGNKMKYNEAR